MRRVAEWAILGGMAVLSGCALATATPPSVEVIDVRLVGIGLTEQQPATTLCVTNPNATELGFRRVAVSVDVSGLPLTDTSSDLAIKLPPMSSTVVPFTAVTTVRNIGPQLLGIVRGGGLDYRLHGSVSLEGALGITVPFSHGGRLDPLAIGTGLLQYVMGPSGTKCGPVVALRS